MKRRLGWVAGWLVVCGVVGMVWGERARGESVPTDQRMEKREAGGGGATSKTGEEKGSVGGRVGWLAISGTLEDAPPPVVWASESRLTMQGIVRRMRELGRDPRSRGLVIYLEEPELTQAQVDQLAEAVEGVRRAGKKVLVFAQAYDLAGYLLGCSADMILLQHGGHLELTGLAMEEIYLGGLLEKIGVRADLVQVGRFKGGREPLTEKGPSRGWSENIEGVLDDLYEQILERIVRGRGLSRAEAERAVGEAWLLSDRELVERGLVDRLVSRDLRGVTEEVFGRDFEWERWGGERGRGGGADSPFAVLQMLFREVRRPISRPSIALIRASGPITGGRSRVGGMEAGLFGIGTVGSQTISQALREAEENELIRGVVIRVDSPGGSALASEAIWQAIYQLREGRGVGEGGGSEKSEPMEGAGGKPVYVSIDSMAASGGYYIASAADRIYAAPSALVGSIGVVGGKLVLGGLYEKLGLGVYRRSRGPMGDPFNSVEPFTYAQRLAVEGAMRRTYEQFLDRVKRGRGERLPEGRLAEIGEGRLFTGRMAKEKGLVDEVGGLERAIADLAERVGLKEGEYDVVELPPPMSLAEYLDSLLGVSGGWIEEPRLWKEAGGWAWGMGWLGGRDRRQALEVLWGLSLLEREPVLALWPVIWRMR